MEPRALLLAIATAHAMGCALVLGFEDHEPFPPGSGGAATSGQTASSGGSGEGGGGSTGVTVLLIPDRGTDAIGMYDPSDGHYISDLIIDTVIGPYDFESANDAVQADDGRIFVSDQLTDSILVFGVDGIFQQVFADAADGLDNVRGIDFRNGELFASVSPTGTPPVVARFDMQGNRLGDFVDDGSDPFDVLFLDNGTMLLADIFDPDEVSLYDVNGGSSISLVSIDFPQQISLLPQGTFAVAGWTELMEVELNGNIVRTMTVNIGRGVYPLDTGQWLLTSDAGVQVIDPLQSRVVQTVRVGTGFTKIERATLPGIP